MMQEIFIDRIVRPFLGLNNRYFAQVIIAVPLLVSYISI